MNLIVDQTTDSRPDAEQIAALLAAVDTAAPGTVQYVEPGDPFFEQPAERVTKRASELRLPVDHMRAEIESGESYRHYFADIYRLDGSRVPIEERTDEWWDAIDYDSSVFPNDVYNSVVRLGTDYFAVGRGAWAVIAETRVDGEFAFEFERFATWQAHKLDAFREHDAAMTRNFLDDHPQIEATKPAWATGMLLDSDDEQTNVFYSADFGHISVTVIGHLEDTGAVTLAEPSYSFYGDLSDVSAYQIAKMIIAASASLEEARAAVEVTH